MPKNVAVHKHHPNAAVHQQKIILENIGNHPIIDFMFNDVGKLEDYKPFFIIEKHPGRNGYIGTCKTCGVERSRFKCGDLDDWWYFEFLQSLKEHYFEGCSEDPEELHKLEMWL